MFVAIATNIKTLITLLLLNDEINLKLGYEIVTAYIVFPQEMVNIPCKNTDAMYNSKNNYKLPILHRFSTYLIICFLLL